MHPTFRSPCTHVHFVSGSLECCSSYVAPRASCPPPRRQGSGDGSDSDDLMRAEMFCSCSGSLKQHMHLPAVQAVTIYHRGAQRPPAGTNPTLAWRQIAVVVFTRFERMMMSTSRRFSQRGPEIYLSTASLSFLLKYDLNSSMGHDILVVHPKLNYR